jgi:TP901 family phage tail tape measure protein
MFGLFFKSGIDKGFEKDLELMNKKLNKFDKNVQTKGMQINKTFQNIGGTISGMISVLAIGAAGKEIVSFSNDLDTALTEVATISTEVTENTEQYKDALLALSTEGSQSAIELTNAYYDIVSAGQDGAAGLELLTAAQTASVAGFVDVGIAADGLTTVINAWGKDASEATNISDIFFKTVEKGKTTFPELGSNIAQVAPIAASLGVSFEEVSAAAATLTKAGTPTAQAFTQIRSSLLSVNKVLGDGWSETMTYQEALAAVREQAGGSITQLREMLGRVEAVNAVLGLTGQNASTAAQDLEAMNGAMGATAKAAEKVTETTQFRIKQLKNNILAALEPLGREASQLLSNIAKRLNEAFESGNVQRYVRVLLQLAKAFAVYKVSVMALNQVQRIRRAILLTNIKAMRLSAITGKQVAGANILMAKSMKAVSAAFAANPVGLLVTALITAIPLIKNLVTSLESSEKKMKKINEEIDKTFAQESAGLEVLKKQLNDSNLQYDDKKRLIEKLNEEYGEYLPSLLTEKSTTEEINTAINQANKALREQIKLRVLNQKATETATKIYELEQKIQKAQSREFLRNTEQVLNAVSAGTGEVLGFRLDILKKNLQEEKELYDNILNELGNSTNEAIKKINKTTPELTITPGSGISDEEREKRRKKAIKALEIEFQGRTNALIKQYGNEEKLQDEFERKQLENRLEYLQRLRILTADQLEKLRIDEQILLTEDELGVSIEQQQLKTLLDEFKTYTDKRTEIEEEYNKRIILLRKNGYEDQAQVAENALQNELEKLDGAILSASAKFQDWMKVTLPRLTKQGIQSLQSQLNKLKVKLQTQPLDPKEVLIVTQQIEELEKAIEKANDAQDTGKKNWKDTIELMNEVNEFIGNLTSTFTNLDAETKNVLDGIAGTVAGVIGLATAVQGVATAVTALEKASVILAAIAAVLQVVNAINTAINNARKLREESYIRELTQIQALNAALVEQNRLYAEGNEFFAEDKWGTVLSGLEAYNQALGYQQEYLEEIEKSSRKVEDTTWTKWLLGGAGVGKAISESSAKKDIKDLQEQADTYATEVERALANIIVRTEDKSKVANFLGFSDEYDSILALYPNVIKANGEVDKEILKLIVDTEKLTDTDKARLKGLVDIMEQAEQAYAQFGEYISSIFGSVGDEVTQAFQQMYESGDDAMSALETSFSEMIEQFTRDAIEFALLQPLIQELNETTKALGVEYAAGQISSEELQESIINQLGTFYDSLNEIQPEILKAYENADKLAAQAGFEEAFEPDKEEEPVTTIEVEPVEIEDKELSRAGQIQQAITEETGGMLVGRLGAIMMSNERLANYSQDMLDLAMTHLVTLNKIKENTDYLPTIAENTKRTYESLESL